MNIPGCTRSWHSNEKPAEPEKVETKKEEKSDEVYVYKAPKPLEPTFRPEIDDNLVEMKRFINPSLIVSLQKAAAEAAAEANAPSTG